jgi:hypothetical protein
MRPFPSWITLALLSAPTAVPAATWYEVELLIFANRDPAALTEETWPPLDGYPDVSAARPLAPPAGALPVDYPAFQLLPSSGLRLEGARRALLRSPDYRPLLHVAWRQPGYGRSRAQSVHLHDEVYVPAEPIPDPVLSPGPGLAPGPQGDGGAGVQVYPLEDRAPHRVMVPALDGTVSLHRSRYLHLGVDLVYREQGRSADAADTPIGDGRLYSFRLAESRRMRSETLHYLDHPGFGVLALVTPVAPPAAAPPEPEPEPGEEPPPPTEGEPGEPPAPSASD